MLAVALAVTACQAGFTIYFTTLDDLVRRLRAAEATGRFNRQLQAFLRPAVLVVDEVGYLPLDRAEANMVFQLVSRRYERGTGRGWRWRGRPPRRVPFLTRSRTDAIFRRPRRAR